MHSVPSHNLPSSLSLFTAGCKRLFHLRFFDFRMYYPKRSNFEPHFMLCYRGGHTLVTGMASLRLITNLAQHGDHAHRKGIVGVRRRGGLDARQEDQPNTKSTASRKRGRPVGANERSGWAPVLAVNRENVGYYCVLTELLLLHPQFC